MKYCDMTLFLPHVELCVLHLNEVSFLTVYQQNWSMTTNGSVLMVCMLWLILRLILTMPPGEDEAGEGRRAGE